MLAAAAALVAGLGGILDDLMGMKFGDPRGPEAFRRQASKRFGIPIVAGDDEIRAAYKIASAVAVALSVGLPGSSAQLLRMAAVADSKGGDEARRAAVTRLLDQTAKATCSVELAASDLLAVLPMYEHCFDKLEPGDVLSVLQNKRMGTDARSAELSLKCNAFGDRRSPAESQAEARKRIADLYYRARTKFQR